MLATPARSLPHIRCCHVEAPRPSAWSPLREHSLPSLKRALLRTEPSQSSFLHRALTSGEVATSMADRICCGRAQATMPSTDPLASLRHMRLVTQIPCDPREGEMRGCGEQ